MGNLLWEELDEETQGKIKALMPEGWVPPYSLTVPVKYKPQLESLEEIDRIIREPPHYHISYYKNP